MNIAQIMTKHPVTVKHNTDIRVALDLMKAQGIHHLPVLSNNNHLIGIITDRDCMVMLRLPVEAEGMTVSEVMSPVTVLAEPSMPASEAVRLMLENHVSCLPVMLEETLIGIVTTSDILELFERLTSSVGYSNGQR